MGDYKYQSRCDTHDDDAVFTFVMVSLPSAPCQDETAASTAILKGEESTMLAASGCGYVRVSVGERRVRTQLRR